MMQASRGILTALLVGALAAGCGDDANPVDVNGTPPAPSHVNVTLSGADVTVTWSAVSDADDYDVQRQSGGTGAFTTIASGLTTTTYTDQAVPTGTQTYRVLANNESGSSGPSDPTTVIVEAEAKVATISGNITGARVLSADTVYTLVGVVLVRDGGRLTIPAGTLIYGSMDIQPTALIVRQGGQIFSEGTEDDPVVFTSPAANPSKGDWGGVVINGRSICNFPGDDCVGEGLSGPYGGTDLDDDSGRIVYTRIEWAGYEVSFGNELNALTLNGVGSGTEIHHIQTHGGLDDGFEWFGGTVDAKYLLATDISDDSFDFSTGWRGRGQFWIAQQDPNDADNGYEVDGNEDDSDALPWTNPTIYNVTLVGKGANGAGGTAGESTRGILLRLGTAGIFANHIITGFGTEGFDIDNAETVNRIAADSLSIVSSIIFSNNRAFSNDDDGIDEQAIWETAAWGNRAVDPMLANPFDRDAPDFRPAADSPAMSGAATPPDDGFFDAVDFVGAVAAGADEWYKAPWTRWGG